MIKRIMPWEKFEQYIANRINGKRVPGSGNGRRKGDVDSDKYLVEAKETSKKYYRLKPELLIKIYKEAGAVNKIPLFAIEFGNGTTEIFIPEKDIEEDILAHIPHRENDIMDLTTKKSITLYEDDSKRYKRFLVSKIIWISIPSYYL